MKKAFIVGLALILICSVLANENLNESLEIKKESGSLYERIERVAKNQFQKDSDLFRPPNPAQQKTWENIIESILNNQLEKAAQDIKSRSYPYEIKIFTDKETKRGYILLQETQPQQAGWGLYVFDLNSTNSLVIESLHTIADANTELEGVDAFLQTRARAFLMAGTHRRANKKETLCTQPGSANNDSESTDYPESDVAHNTATMFQTTHETLVNMFPNTIAVQIHGMAERQVCPNVFVSSGTKFITENSKKLLECFVKNKVEAGVYEGTKDGCPLGATTNVQGRFSNGEKENPCAKSVKAAPDPGHFIHIEQEPSIRRSKDSWQPIIEALKCAFPAI